MKYLIMSDLHGAAEEAEKVLSYYDKLGCDSILLLGDLLNHGPRNKVPESYDPQRLADLLNGYKDVMISVRGNCDSEVDSMMFDFPCNAPYQQLLIKQEGTGKVRKVFVTHGHLHRFKDADELPHLALKAGDIVLSGHTHVSGVFELENGIVNVNPGSTVLGKGGTPPGFGFMDEEQISIYDLGGNRLAGHALFG